MKRNIGFGKSCNHSDIISFLDSVLDLMDKGLINNIVLGCNPDGVFSSYALELEFNEGESE